MSERFWVSCHGKNNRENERRGWASAELVTSTLEVCSFKGPTIFSVHWAQTLT